MEPNIEKEGEDFNLEQQHPWPGLRAFSENDASFFFGREQEVKDIARMIRQETITVLFGKSGLGKSSILQAGVSPVLREDAFLPIYIRLNHHEDALPLEDQVEVFIEEAIEANNLDAPQPIRDETLWEYFHKKPNDWWDASNQLLKPVLIFDQFEEILTIGQENPERTKRCLSFLTELEDLIENRPPTALVNRFKQEKGLARNYDFERTDYRVLISLREDYLADLEGLRERLRSIMNNRYRLLPMTGEQAINVILKPGGHLVKPEVAKEIIDLIGLAQGLRPTEDNIRNIEPTLLSVILRELNCHRIEAGKDNISSALVSAKRPEHILLKFYESAVKGLPKKVHRFIEEQLITASGSRNRVAEEDAIARFEISHADIATLINRRIIQRDKMAQVTWLELSHDTLTPVVFSHAEEHLRSRKLRRFMLQVSAVILVITGLVIGNIYNQARERELQVAKASKVALDLATELESNSDMSIASKQLMLSRLQENFEDLRVFAEDSRLLRWRYAYFLTKRANVQFEGGYIQLAIDDVKTAEKLIANDEITDDDEFFMVIKVRLLLASAEAEYYQRNFEAVHKNLGLAQLYTNSQHLNTTNNRLTRLKQRLNRLRIRTLIDQGKVTEASILIISTEAEIRKLLANQNKENSNESKRFLYIELYKLANEKPRLTQYGFYKQKDLYNELKTDLEDADKLFKSHDHQVWQESYANNFLTKSHKLKNENKITESRAALDSSIDLLADRVRNNNDNLKYRYDLGTALITRAIFTEKDDVTQAKLDISTARSLAFTIRRDSTDPYMAYILTSKADLSELRILSYKTKGNLNISFDRFIARQDSYDLQFPPNISRDVNKLVAIYWKIRGHTNRAKSIKPKKSLKTTNASDKQIAKNKVEKKAIKKLVDDAKLILESLEKRVADKNYIANRRFWIFESILRSSVPEILGNETWLEYAIEGDKQLDIILENSPNTGRWIAVKSWTLATIGHYYTKQGIDLDSAKYYEKLVKFALSHLELSSGNMQLSTNTIWGIKELIGSYSRLSKFKKAVNASELLFELTDENQQLVDVNFSENKLLHWVALKKRLKIVARQLIKKQKALEQNNSHELEQEIEPQRALQEVTQLNVLQEKLNKVIKMSSTVIEQLRSIGKGKSGISSDDSQNHLNIKSIKINKLLKKVDGKTYAKQPMGWKTADIYAAPWSYTLVGKEIEIYSKRLNRQVLRVRVTELPFYETGRFLTIEDKDESNNIQIRYYLESEDKLLELKGNSAEIHKANKQFPINLDSSAKAVSYLRFFTTFVHAELGAFPLIETSNQIDWQKGVTSEVKIRVSDLLRPIYVWQEDGQTDWYVTASVQYSNAIFHAKFKILETGAVDMLEESPVASDLPIAVFKLAGSSGRSEHFVRGLYLGITEGITIYNRSDEINKLHELLGNSSKNNIQYRESILSDIIALSRSIYSNYRNKNFIAYNKIQKFIAKEPANTHLENRIQLKKLLTLMINNKLEVIKSQQELSKPEKLANYLSLSFYQLFASDNKGALQSAKKGMAIDSEYLPLQTNYAHALLFLDRVEEAREIYMKHLGKKIGNKLWQDIIIDDFDQFVSVGIKNTNMDEIRKILASAKR